MGMRVTSPVIKESGKHLERPAGVGGWGGGGEPAPSLSTIKEDISAFSKLENTPFSLTFGAKKTPFFYTNVKFLS